MVLRARRAGKRLVAQEFGASGKAAGPGAVAGGYGSKAPGLKRHIDAIEAHGLPWMVWQVSSPNSATDEEVYTEDAAAWALLRSRARGGGGAGGRARSVGVGSAFSWPELAP